MYLTVVCAKSSAAELLLQDRGICHPASGVVSSCSLLLNFIHPRFQVGSFMGNLAASSFFLRLLHAAGGGITFFLFATIVFLATVFILLVVPETKDKEPHSIAADLPECECCPTYTELTDERLEADDTPGEGTPLPDAGAEKWI